VYWVGAIRTVGQTHRGFCNARVNFRYHRCEGIQAGSCRHLPGPPLEARLGYFAWTNNFDDFAVMAKVLELLQHSVGIGLTGRRP